MVVKIDNGVVRINDLTFLQFCSFFRGRVITKKGTDSVVPKFVLFWKGLLVSEVKNKFDLRPRKNDD